MKTPLTIPIVLIALALPACVTTQPQQAETEQPASGGARSARDVRDASHEASATARDVRGAINDLKSIFR